MQRDEPDDFGADPSELNPGVKRGHERSSAFPDLGAIGGGRPSPWVVPQSDRDEIASKLAGCLTEAIAEFLECAERRLLHHSDGVRVDMLGGLESQRANVESLVKMFAEQLQQQQVTLSFFREELNTVRGMLNRHTEAIVSLSEAQAHQVALLHQLVDVLRGMAHPVPPAGISAKAGAR